jgi:predicted ATP-grasp superfamily ATP-dependent carboligase
MALKRCFAIDEFDRSVAVLVLKTRPYPLHHGTLGVIRSLGRAGAAVYCSLEDSAAPAAYSRYVRSPGFNVLSIDDPSACVADLLRFQHKIDKKIVIIATDDGGAIFLAEHADALRPGFLLPAQPSHVPRMVASKDQLPALCAGIGISVPAIAVVHSADEIAAVAESVDYPAVVKIAQSALLPVGKPATSFVRDRHEISRYFDDVAAHSEADIVVQEYLPEDYCEDWFYHGYHGPGGVRVVGFTGQKIRSYPPFLGATSYGVSQVNQQVIELACRLLTNLKYCGIVELEFRFDKRDHQYKLLDINPRVGAQFQFLHNDAGIDVVRALHLDLTAHAVAVRPQVEKITFVDDLRDAAAFPAYWRRGSVGLPAWCLQFMGANVRSWLGWDDMRPILAAIRLLAARFRIRKLGPKASSAQ